VYNVSEDITEAIAKTDAYGEFKFVVTDNTDEVYESFVQRLSSSAVEKA